MNDMDTVKDLIEKINDKDIKVSERVIDRLKKVEDCDEAFGYIRTVSCKMNNDELRHNPVVLCQYDDEKYCIKIFSNDCYKKRNRKGERDNGR